MPFNSECRKVQTNTMSAYRKQKRCIYCHCQLGHITPGHALVASVCILMLPMLCLAAEHMQLKTTYQMNQLHAHPPHMISNPATLVLSSLNNVLPAIVLQNSIVRSNIGYHSYTSSHSVRRAPFGLHPNFLSVLVRRAVVILLLLLSGDVETNPGPVGQQLSVADLHVVVTELNDICTKWYNIGLQLNLSVGTLDSIKEQFNSPSDCLRETLKTWLKIYPLPPTWSNIIKALRNSVVGEVRLAAELEHKYCPTQFTSVAATHHLVSPVPDLALSHAHTSMPPPCLSTTPLTQPPVFASPHPVPPQPHPDIPFCSVPYYPSSIGYQVSTPLVPLPTTGAASTATPPTVHLVAHSEVSHVTPSPMPVSPSSVPVQLTTPQTPTIDAVQTVTVPQHPVQLTVAAGLSGIEFQDLLLITPVPERIWSMEDKFAQLVDKVQDGIVEQNIPLRKLKRCITLLPASIKHQHVTYIEEKLRAITNSESLEEIFGLLNLYWDFLNYTLLEHIVTNFGNNDTKAAIAKYKSELTAFRKATRLADFITHWPCTGKFPPDMSKLVIKMEKDWSNCTLEDVEKFRTTLTQKLLLQSFAVALRDAEKGCISLTWLIPSSIVKLLAKDIQDARLDLDWFKKHHIDRLVIDGHNLYSSETFRYGSFLRKLYTSQWPPLTLSSSPLPQKLLPFKLAKIEGRKADLRTDEFTKHYLRGDIDDVGSFGTIYKKSPIQFEEVGSFSASSQKKLILIEGAPGVGKTTFSWEFCKKWARDEILQDHSLLLLLPLRDNSLKETKTLSDLFYHPNSDLQQAVVQEVTSDQGRGVAIWLEAWDELDHESRENTSVFLDLISSRILPLATIFVTSRPWASKHLRVNCGHHIFQHVEILTSAKDQIAYYVNKIEAEAHPSLAVKFTDYLSSNPVIRAAMYTPVTAKMAAEVFSSSQHSESAPPTTMTELFTTFTHKTLVDHLSTHPVYHKQQLKVTTFSDLPTDVYKQFQDLCRMAYEGILNRQQLVFSMAHLPTGFAHLGLMQEVPQLYTEGRVSSYHFIHLTLQEYLAAVHISQLPAHKQTGLVQEHLGSGHFKITLRFLAGLTGILPEVFGRLIHNSITMFHFLFEAKDISVTTGTLLSDLTPLKSQYYWTPLDYYVTGHAISLSNHSWDLDFSACSIDDEKIELFCQGYAIAVTKSKGHISYANFSYNGFTSKTIQTLNIFPHILQNMKHLKLRNNKLDRNACDLLAKVVPSMNLLQELTLDNNPIGSGGTVKMIKALSHGGNRMIGLSLSKTGIGVPDCEALCELMRCSTLKYLHVNHNNLSSESVTSIITGVSSLHVLGIMNSHFSMENVVSLASILTKAKRRSGLSELWLQDCHISSEGADELATALHKNSSLKYLYLGDNPIGVEGASSMSDMMKYNTSLITLDLRNDSIGEEGARQLIESHKCNVSVSTRGQNLWLPEKYKSKCGHFEDISFGIHWL